MWILTRLEQRLLWGLFLPLTLVLPSSRGLILLAAAWPLGLAFIWFAKHHFNTLTSGNTDQVKLAALVGGHCALMGAVIYVTGMGVSRIMLWLAAQKIAGIVAAAMIATMSVTFSHTIARTLLDQTAQAESAIWSDSQLNR